MVVIMDHIDGFAKEVTEIVNFSLEASNPIDQKIDRLTAILAKCISNLENDAIKDKGATLHSFHLVSEMIIQLTAEKQSSNDPSKVNKLVNTIGNCVLEAFNQGLTGVPPKSGNGSGDHTDLKKGFYLYGKKIKEKMGDSAENKEALEHYKKIGAVLKRSFVREEEFADYQKATNLSDEIQVLQDSRILLKGSDLVEQFRTFVTSAIDFQHALGACDKDIKRALSICYVQTKNAQNLDKANRLQELQVQINSFREALKNIENDPTKFLAQMDPFLDAIAYIKALSDDVVTSRSADIDKVTNPDSKKTLERLHRDWSGVPQKLQNLQAVGNKFKTELESFNESVTQLKNDAKASINKTQAQEQQKEEFCRLIDTAPLFNFTSKIFTDKLNSALVDSDTKELDHALSEFSNALVAIKPKKRATGAGSALPSLPDYVTPLEKYTDPVKAYRNIQKRTAFLLEKIDDKELSQQMSEALNKVDIEVIRRVPAWYQKVFSRQSFSDIDKLNTLCATLYETQQALQNPDGKDAAKICRTLAIQAKEALAFVGEGLNRDDFDKMAALLEEEISTKQKPLQPQKPSVSPHLEVKDSLTQAVMDKTECANLLQAKFGELQNVAELFNDVFTEQLIDDYPDVCNILGTLVAAAKNDNFAEVLATLKHFANIFASKARLEPSLLASIKNALVLVDKLNQPLAIKNFDALIVNARLSEQETAKALKEVISKPEKPDELFLLNAAIQKALEVTVGASTPVEINYVLERLRMAFVGVSPKEIDENENINEFLHDFQSYLHEANKDDLSTTHTLIEQNLQLLSLPQGLEAWKGDVQQKQVAEFLNPPELHDSVVKAKMSLDRYSGHLQRADYFLSMLIDGGPSVKAYEYLDPIKNELLAMATANDKYYKLYKNRDAEDNKYIKEKINSAIVNPDNATYEDIHEILSWYQQRSENAYKFAKQEFDKCYRFDGLQHGELFLQNIGGQVVEFASPVREDSSYLSLGNTRVSIRQEWDKFKMDPRTSSEWKDAFNKKIAALEEKQQALTEELKTLQDHSMVHLFSEIQSCYQKIAAQEDLDEKKISLIAFISDIQQRYPEFPLIVEGYDIFEEIRGVVAAQTLPSFEKAMSTLRDDCIKLIPSSRIETLERQRYALELQKQAFIAANNKMLTEFPNESTFSVEFSANVERAFMSILDNSINIPQLRIEELRISTVINEKRIEAFEKLNEIKENINVNKHDKAFDELQSQLETHLQEQKLSKEELGKIIADHESSKQSLLELEIFITSIEDVEKLVNKGKSAVSNHLLTYIDEPTEDNKIALEGSRQELQMRKKQLAILTAFKPQVDQLIERYNDICNIDLSFSDRDPEYSDSTDVMILTNAHLENIIKASRDALDDKFANPAYKKYRVDYAPLCQMEPGIELSKISEAVIANREIARHELTISEKKITLVELEIEKLKALIDGIKKKTTYLENAIQQKTSTLKEMADQRNFFTSPTKEEVELQLEIKSLTEELEFITQKNDNGELIVIEKQLKELKNLHDESIYLITVRRSLKVKYNECDLQFTNGRFRQHKIRLDVETTNSMHNKIIEELGLVNDRIDRIRIEYSTICAYKGGLEKADEALNQQKRQVEEIDNLILGFSDDINEINLQIKELDKEMDKAALKRSKDPSAYKNAYINFVKAKNALKAKQQELDLANRRLIIETAHLKALQSLCDAGKLLQEIKVIVNKLQDPNPWKDTMNAQLGNLTFEQVLQNAPLMTSLKALAEEIAWPALVESMHAIRQKIISLAEQAKLEEEQKHEQDPLQDIKDAFFEQVKANLVADYEDMLGQYLDDPADGDLLEGLKIDFATLKPKDVKAVNTFINCVNDYLQKKDKSIDDLDKMRKAFDQLIAPQKNILTNAEAIVAFQAVLNGEKVAIALGKVGEELCYSKFLKEQWNVKPIVLTKKNCRCGDGTQQVLNKMIEELKIKDRDRKNPRKIIELASLLQHEELSDGIKDFATFFKERYETIQMHIDKKQEILSIKELPHARLYKFCDLDPHELALDIRNIKDLELICDYLKEFVNAKDDYEGLSQKIVEAESFLKEYEQVNPTFLQFFDECTFHMRNIAKQGQAIAIAEESAKVFADFLTLRELVVDIIKNEPEKIDQEFIESLISIKEGVSGNPLNYKQIGQGMEFLKNYATTKLFADKMLAVMELRKDFIGNFAKVIKHYKLENVGNVGCINDFAGINVLTLSDDDRITFEQLNDLLKKSPPLLYGELIESVDKLSVSEFKENFILFLQDQAFLNSIINNDFYTAIDDSLNHLADKLGEHPGDAKRPLLLFRNDLNKFFANPRNSEEVKNNKDFWNFLGQLAAIDLNQSVDTLKSAVGAWSNNMYAFVREKDDYLTLRFGASNILNHYAPELYNQVFDEN